MLGLYDLGFRIGFII